VAPEIGRARRPLGISPRVFRFAFAVRKVTHSRRHYRDGLQSEFASWHSYLGENAGFRSVILGASRLEQLTDTLAAADYKLDSAVKAKLDEVSLEYRRGDAGS
jgi:hypothetical protein